MEYGASNCDHADEDEAAHHMEDEILQVVEESCYEMHNSSSHRVESPAQPSVQEDVVATYKNALVAYQAPEYRGEPLPMFERQVLHRLDTLTDDQKTYFEMTKCSGFISSTLSIEVNHYQCLKDKFLID